MPTLLASSQLTIPHILPPSTLLPSTLPLPSSPSAAPVVAAPALSHTPFTKCNHPNGCSGCLTPFGQQLTSLHHRLVHPPTIPNVPFVSTSVPPRRGTSRHAEGVTYLASSYHAVLATEKAQAWQQGVGGQQSIPQPHYPPTSPISHRLERSRPSTAAADQVMDVDSLTSTNSSETLNSEQEARLKEGREVLQAFLAQKQSHADALEQRRRKAGAATTQRPSSSSSTPSSAVSKYAPTTASPFYNSKHLHLTPALLASELHHGKSHSSTDAAAAAVIAPMSDPLHEALTASRNFGRPTSANSRESQRRLARELIEIENRGLGGRTVEQIDRQIDALLDPFASGSKIPQILAERQLQQEMKEANENERQQLMLQSLAASEQTRYGQKLSARQRAALKAKKAASQLKDSQHPPPTHTLRPKTPPMLMPHPVRGFVIRLKESVLPNKLVVVAQPELKKMEEPNPHLHLPEDYVKHEQAKGKWRKFRTKEYAPLQTMPLGGGVAGRNQTIFERVYPGRDIELQADSQNVMTEEEHKSHSMPTSRAHSPSRLHHVPDASSKFFHSPDARALQSALTGVIAPASSASPVASALAAIPSPYTDPLTSSLTSRSAVVMDDVLGAYAKSGYGQQKALTSRTRHWTTQHHLKQAQKQSLTKMYEESRKGVKPQSPRSIKEEQWRQETSTIGKEAQQVLKSASSPPSPSRGEETTDYPYEHALLHPHVKELHLFDEKTSTPAHEPSRSIPPTQIKPDSNSARPASSPHHIAHGSVSHQLLVHHPPPKSSNPQLAPKTSPLLHPNVLMQSSQQHDQQHPGPWQSEPIQPHPRDSADLTARSILSHAPRENSTTPIVSQPSHQQRSSDLHANSNPFQNVDQFTHTPSHNSHFSQQPQQPRQAHLLKHDYHSSPSSPNPDLSIGGATASAELGFFSPVSHSITIHNPNENPAQARLQQVHAIAAEEAARAHTYGVKLEKQHRLEEAAMKAEEKKLKQEQMKIEQEEQQMQQQLQDAADAVTKAKVEQKRVALEEKKKQHEILMIAKAEEKKMKAEKRKVEKQEAEKKKVLEIQQAALAAAAADAFASDSQPMKSQPPTVAIFKSSEHVDSTGRILQPETPASKSLSTTTTSSALLDNIRANLSADPCTPSVPATVQRPIGGHVLESEIVEQIVKSESRGVLLAKDGSSSAIPSIAAAIAASPQVKLRNNTAPASSRVRTSRSELWKQAQAQLSAREPSTADTPLMTVKPLTAASTPSSEPIVPSIHNAMVQSQMGSAPKYRPGTHHSPPPKRSFLLSVDGQQATDNGMSNGGNGFQIHSSNFLSQSFPLRQALGRRANQANLDATPKKPGSSSMFLVARFASRIKGNKIVQSTRQGVKSTTSASDEGDDRAVGVKSPSFRRSWLDLKLQAAGPTRKQLIAERQKQLQWEIHRRLMEEQEQAEAEGADSFGSFGASLDLEKPTSTFVPDTFKIEATSPNVNVGAEALKRQQRLMARRVPTMLRKKTVTSSTSTPSKSKPSARTTSLTVPPSSSSSTNTSTGRSIPVSVSSSSTGQEWTTSIIPPTPTAASLFSINNSAPPKTILNPMQPSMTYAEALAAMTNEQPQQEQPSSDPTDRAYMASSDHAHEQPQSSPPETLAESLAASGKDVTVEDEDPAANQDDEDQEPEDDHDNDDTEDLGEPKKARWANNTEYDSDD